MKLRLAMIAVASAASSALAAPPNMQPGLWEITMNTEMVGMPMKMPPQTIRHCYRKEDIKESKDALPGDKSCKVDDFKQSGNTVHWKTTCNKDGMKMVGTGEVTYAGNGYSGTVNMVGDSGGTKMVMTQKYSAKRLGDCK